MTECQAGTEGLGEVGEDGKKGRGRLESGGNVLQGDEIGGVHIWIGDLGPIGGNGENSGRYSHRFSEKNYRKVGVVEFGWYMVYSIGAGSAGSGRN